VFVCYFIMLIWNVSFRVVLYNAHMERECFLCYFIMLVWNVSFRVLLYNAHMECECPCATFSDRNRINFNINLPNIPLIPEIPIKILPSFSAIIPHPKYITLLDVSS
jgi:hypothetical protein